MSADRNESHRADGPRSPGRFRRNAQPQGQDQHSGLRDAIAYLNRESVALPAPEAPAWATQPAQPAHPGQPGQQGQPGQPGQGPGQGQQGQPGQGQQSQPGQQGQGQPAQAGPAGADLRASGQHPVQYQPAGPAQGQQPGVAPGPYQGPQGPHHGQHRAGEQPLAPVRELRPPTPSAPAGDVRRPGGYGPADYPGPGVQMAAGGQYATLPPAPAAWPPARPGSGHEAIRHDLERRELTGGPGSSGNSAGQRDGINAFANIDWAAIEVLRKQVRDRVTEQFPSRDAGSEEQRRAFGMAVIEESVNAWYARSLSRGLAPSEHEQHTMRRAVAAAVFGMGRLTPLLEHPEIENIEYRGCDDGYVVYSDGRVERGPAIADTDEAMLADLQYWAAKQNRTLSHNTPHLYLTLEGGARLTATMGTSKRPNLVIRRHRVVDVTLDDLVARGMVSPAIAAFLRAAVLSNSNIVVTGPLNSGKTTLLRALAAEIPPMERYATLETEYELHLDEVGRHPRMVAYQALVGTAEQGYNGRRAGEVTLTDIMEVALRMNFTRLIVGEIRGAEVVAMLEAVSTGGRGSLCTMHANSARDVFGRFVTLCTRTNMSRDSAVQLAAESLHYIVNVQMDNDSASGLQNTRSARRFVDQIVEVNGMGDGSQPSATDVFAAGPDGRAVYAHRPERLAKLQKAGFDPNWLMFGNDQWNLGSAVSQQQGQGSGSHGGQRGQGNQGGQGGRGGQQGGHQGSHQQSQGHGHSFHGAQPVQQSTPPPPGAPMTQVPEPDAEQFDQHYLQGRQRLDHYADDLALEPPSEGRRFRLRDPDARGGGRGRR